MSKGFFSEIRDNPIWTYHLMIVMLFLGTALLWVYVAIPEQEKNAIIYMIMLIVFGFSGLLDAISNKLKHINIRLNALGKKPLKAIIFGVVTIGILSIVRPQTLIQPLSVVDPTTLSFLFIVIAAPLVEAMFFRGLLQQNAIELIESYLIKDHLIAGVLATISQSLIFAFFHVNIFGQGGDFVPYFIFGVIATFGMYLFRSIGFEFGLHTLNNYIAWTAAVVGM